MTREQECACTAIRSVRLYSLYTAHVRTCIRFTFCALMPRLGLEVQHAHQCCRVYLQSAITYHRYHCSTKLCTFRVFERVEQLSIVSWILNSPSPGHLPGVESDSRVRPSRVRAGATPEPTLP